MQRPSKRVTKYVFGIAFVLVLLALSVGLISLLSGADADKPLSAEAQATLRERYPLALPAPFTGISYHLATYAIESKVSTCNAHIVAEVIEVLPDGIQHLDLSNGRQPPATSGPEYEIWKQTNFLSFTLTTRRVRVLDIFYQGDGHDPMPMGAEIAVGQEIVVSALDMAACYDPIPVMVPGTRLVMGLVMPPDDADWGKGLDYTFTASGLYYVVDGDHVLSAIEEYAPEIYSGLPLTQFKTLLLEARAVSGK
ncbi:MAG: hypothetical protein GX153_00400 [Clostridiaceae bacterium]|jgi:hypothetical protein|nr:hypothetical protein [Clostridiaceae bacterium]